MCSTVSGAARTGLGLQQVWSSTSTAFCIALLKQAGTVNLVKAAAGPCSRFHRKIRNGRVALTLPHEKEVLRAPPLLELIFLHHESAVDTRTGRG